MRRNASQEPMFARNRELTGIFTGDEGRGSHLSNKNVPELSDIGLFFNFLGLSHSEYQYILWYRERMYKLESIPKRSGGFRILFCPDKRLKYLQRRINLLLLKIFSVRNPVHGFVQNRSVVTNARAHIGRPYVLNIDIEKFFPSIELNRVVGVLVAVGVDRDVASAIAELCCYREALPQGAPTSPILSNMACYNLDKSFMAFSRHRQLRYTRYADDITLSSNSGLEAMLAAPRGPGRLTSEELNQEIVNLLARSGFRLNQRKIRSFGPKSRTVITGIIVGDRLGVSRELVSRIRSYLFDIEKRGYPAAQSRYVKKIGVPCSLHRHLRGSLEWMASVKGRGDPVFQGFAVRFNRIFSGAVEVIYFPSPEQVLSECVRVVEQVKIGKGGVQQAERQGTIFYVTNVGWITAAHCVDLHDDVEIFLPGKFRVRGRVAFRCGHRDIAVVTAPIEIKHGLKLASGNMRQGDHFFVCGYPGFGPGDSVTRRPGTVSSVYTKSAVSRFDSTARFSGGMSGGPIVDSEFNVNGLVYKGGVGEERDIGTPSSEILKFLKENGINLP